MSAGSFELQLEAFAKKAKANADLVVKKVAFEAFRRVILRTPVDTGRARANWSVTLGPISSVVPVAWLLKSDKDGNSTIAQAQATVNAFKGGNGSISMTNSLPYIGVLEYGLYPQPGTDKTSGGYSSQAPNGMVRITVEEIQSFITQAAQGIK